MMTVMERAFVAAGGPRAREAALSVAIAQFQNNGGSYSEAQRLLDAAYEMGGGARDTVPGKGQQAGAPLSLQNDDEVGRDFDANKASSGVHALSSTKCSGEGPGRRADEANDDFPFVAAADANLQDHCCSADKAKPGASREVCAQRDRAGHLGFAAKAVNSMPRPVSPVRIAAMTAARLHGARTVLDSFTVRDGRSIGDVTFNELESLRFENAREAAVIRLVMKHVANAPIYARVRDVINADTLERMIQKASEVADV